MPAPATSVRDRVGRAVLVLQSVASIGAFALGIVTMSAAGPDRLFVESWRTFGFLVFAGLFAVLAARPRTSPGVWELIVVHKVAVTTVGFANINAYEAGSAATIDLVLVILTVLAWVLCRGWLSWQRATAPADPGAVPAGVASAA